MHCGANLNDRETCWTWDPWVTPFTPAPKMTETLKAAGEMGILRWQRVLTQQAATFHSSQSYRTWLFLLRFREADRTGQHLGECSSVSDRQLYNLKCQHWGSTLLHSCNLKLLKSSKLAARIIKKTMQPQHRGSHGKNERTYNTGAS